VILVEEAAADDEPEHGGVEGFAQDAAGV